eukprot:COSAG01_NODE_131_length_24907_cov_19.802201_8_plen_156_part_00
MRRAIPQRQWIQHALLTWRRTWGRRCHVRGTHNETDSGVRCCGSHASTCGHTAGLGQKPCRYLISCELGTDPTNQIKPGSRRFQFKRANDDRSCICLQTSCSYQPRGASILPMHAYALLGCAVDVDFLPCQICDRFLSASRHVRCFLLICLVVLA